MALRRLDRGQQLFTSNGTWLCPGGITKVWVTASGGGGNGGTANANTGGNYAYGGGGGSSGARCTKQELAVVPGTTYTITVGAQGQATSFGALLTLPGGNNGGPAFPGLAPSPGGVAGQTPSSTFDSVTSRGAGGAGGLGGAGGNYAGNTLNGANAPANSGGGGGGCSAGGTPGNGAAGFLIVEW